MCPLISKFYCDYSQERMHNIADCESVGPSLCGICSLFLSVKVISSLINLLGVLGGRTALPVAITMSGMSEGPDIN